MPASTRIPGPRFGYLPDVLGAALTTAPTLPATSESALTRSTSTWSMTAISPGRSRLVRFLVRRSTRAVPVTPGAVSDARPRRRVPMRMVAMVPRGSDTPSPTRTSDGSITQSERHRLRSQIGHGGPGVAAPEGDRPVTSVTGVTAGASASRSTATVLADDLVEELAGQRQPDAAAGAAVAAASGRPTASAEEIVEAMDAQVVPLNPRPAAEEGPLSPDPVTVPPTEPAPPAAAGAEPADAPGPGRRSRRRERRGPTLREQRRQRTREAIIAAAAELFTERGFDHVSVMEIAQRAGVVEKTVFNHFPVKEGLVFEADPPMRAALLDAVRMRPAGESVAAAAGSFVVAAVSQLGSPAAAEGMTEMARVIRGSRTLQARERDIIGMLTDTLAEQIVLETRAAASELEPWLAANAVLGLYSALLELARDRVLAGGSGPELVAELRTRGERGLALLQFGLAGYAKRR